MSTVAAAIGVDIGTGYIKAVELRQRGQRFQVLKASCMEVPDSAYQSGMVSDVKEAGRALQELLEGFHFRSRRLIAGIADHGVSIRRLRLPAMPEDELKQALRWEAKKFMSFPVNDVSDIVVDYIKILDLEDAPKTHEDLLVVAAPLRHMQDHAAAFSAAGIVPAVLDVSLLVLPLTFSREATSCFVDIGKTSTGILIVSKTGIQVVRTLPWGGERFTHAIARDMGIGMQEAETYKCTELDVSVTASQEARMPQLGALLGELADEIVQTIKYHRSRRYDSAENDDVSEAIVVGGGALVKGLSEWLHRALSMTVTIGNPFIDAELLDMSPEYDLIVSGAWYSSAVGLAREGLKTV
jgi:type IV pilus assembly protein PilM